MASLSGGGDEDRRAVRSVALQFFVNGALFASLFPRLPELRDRVELSLVEVGFLLSAAAAFGLFGSVSIGRIVAAWGTRRVILVAGSLVPASLIVVGLASSPVWLLLGLAGMFTFDVFVDVAMNLQGSWLSARRRVPIISRLHGLWSLGTLVGGLISSRLAAQGVSIEVHMVGVAMLLSTTLLYVVPGLLRVDEVDSNVQAKENGSKPEGGFNPSTPPLVNGLIVLFVVAGFVSLALETIALDWAAFRLTDDLLVEPGTAALGYVAAAGGMTAARFLGDSISARIGTYRYGVLSIGLSGGGMVLSAVGSSVVVVIVGFALFGLGNAALMPTLYDRAAQSQGGTSLGALTAGIRIGALSVPPVVGALAATDLSVGSALAIVAGPCLVGFYLINRRIASTGVADGRYDGSVPA